MGAVEILRDALFGNPPSPTYMPSREGVLAAFTDLSRIAQGAAAGLRFYATKPALTADTTQPLGTLAYVYDDPTPANNTVYHYETGGWVVDDAYYANVASVVQPLVDRAETAADSAEAFVAAVQYLTDVLKNETIADDLLSVVIGDRLYATLTEATGLTLYKTMLAAAGTRLDDQPGVLLSDRTFAGPLGPIFQPGNAISGTLLEMLAVYPGDDTRLFGEVRTDGSWYLPKQVLSATAVFEDQPTVPALSRLGGTFTLDDSPDYVLLASTDGSGNQQLRTRRKTDGRLSVITTTGNNTSPRLTTDNRVVYVSSLTGLTQRVADAGEPARAIEPTTAVTLLGDSMIENGNTGIGDELIAAYPGRSVISQGIGGQWTQLIAARFGAEPVNVTVPGGVIPTSGSFTVVPDVDFLRIGSDNQNIVCRSTFAGYSGTVLRNGPTAAPTYQITLASYPSSPVAVSGAVPLIVTSATARNTTDASTAASLDAMRGGTLILRAGKNDPDRGDYNQAAYISRIKAITLRMTPLWRQVIVMGVTNGLGQVPTSVTAANGDAGKNASISAANSRLSLQRIADANVALRAAFPDNFIDPQANHVANGGTTSVTVDGATFDVLSSTTAPDGTHEAQGAPQNRTVALVQAAMTAKGY